MSPPPAGPGRSQALLAALAALALGTVLALLVAGPDLPRLGAELPGRRNDDALHAVYLHHEVHEALLDGRFDLVDPDQLYPVGTPLLLMNGGNILEMLVSGLFRLLLPFPGWLSAAALAWIPLNLLAFVPLGRFLWGRWGVTLAAGACWAILPPLLGQLEALRLTQLVLVGLPVAVLGLLRLSEEGGRKAMLLAGGGFALLGLGYWFYALMLACCAPLFLVHGLRRRPWRPLLLETAGAALLAFVLVLPVLGQILWPVMSGGWSPAPPMTAEHMSPVFLDALQLGPVQPHGLRGWLPLVLLPGIGIAVWKGQRRGLFAGCALLCLVFALGPAQDLLGWRWLLPSYPLWRWFPGFDRLYHPDRWLAPGGLFLVLLAAEGLARWRPATTWLLPVGTLLQLYIAGNLPLGSWRFQAPEPWQALVEVPMPGAVIGLPLLKNPNSAAWQHLHGRPLLGGMVENQPWFLPPDFVGFVEQSPLLLDLWQLSQGRQPSPVLYQEDLDRLRAAGFSLLVLDAEAWKRRGAGRDPMPALETVLGEPVWRSPAGAIWQLPEKGREGTAPAGRSLSFEGPPGADPRQGD